MGSLEFATKFELLIFKDRVQDGVDAKSVHVRLMGFIIVRASLAFSVNIFATVFSLDFLSDASSVLSHLSSKVGQCHLNVK